MRPAAERRRGHRRRLDPALLSFCRSDLDLDDDVEVESTHEVSAPDHLILIVYKHLKWTTRISPAPRPSRSRYTAFRHQIRTRLPRRMICRKRLWWVVIPPCLYAQGLVLVDQRVDTRSLIRTTLSTQIVPRIARTSSTPSTPRTSAV